MSVETVKLKLPASLAQELSAASQEFLADILERGLRELKTERAAERYSQGKASFPVTNALQFVSKRRFGGARF